jgi:beta-aspartyl-dipeptidase (metallo-type)
VAEIPARVFHPTHINRERWLFAEAHKLAQRGCTMDLMAFPDDGNTLLASEAIAQWRKDGHPMDKLTCSSDGAGCLPTFDEDGRLERMDIGKPITLLQTIQQLLRMGEKFEDFLPVFTRNVANVMALKGRGSLEVGHGADLVIMEPDGTLVHVLANGQSLIQDGIPTKHGCFEHSL